MEATTALVVIPPEQLDRARQVAALTIASPDQEANAVDGLAFVQAVLRGMEKERVKMKEPHLEAGRKIDASFAAIKAPFVTAEGNVKAALMAWKRAETARIAAEQTRVSRENAEREQKAREEEDRLRREKEEQVRKDADAAGMSKEDGELLAQLEAADVPALVPAQEPMPTQAPTTTRSTVGTATIRTIPDRDAIQKAVDAGERSIDGVRIYPIWTFEIYESTAVPEKYRKDSLAGGRVK